MSGASDGNAVVSDEKAISSDTAGGNAVFTPLDKAKLQAANGARAAFLREHVKIGDLLTHAKCGSRIEEHGFTGWDGLWLCGRATSDTRRTSEDALKRDNNISPMNVLYVNRIEVDALPFYAEMERAAPWPK